MGLVSSTNPEMKYGIWRFEERRLMHIIRRNLAVDRGDDVASVQPGLCTRTVRQHRHHLQPMPKRIEDQTCTIEDLRLIGFFCLFKVELPSHTVKDLGELPENTLTDIPRQITFVRRVGGEMRNHAGNMHRPDAHVVYPSQIGFRGRPRKATPVI